MKNYKITALILAVLMTIQTFTAVSAGASGANSCAVSPEELNLPLISADSLRAEMEKTVSKGHPYMIATKEYVDRVREYAFGKDETLTNLYSYVKSEADKLLKTPIFTIDDEVASKSMNNTKAAKSYNHIMILGLVYLVEGDERYAQRAYDQAEYLCGLDSWGTLQLIDNVQFAWAVGFCYDWLYDWLDEEQKGILVGGLRRLHLDMAMDVFRNPDNPEYKWSYHQSFFSKNNHGLMDTSCTFLAAMAIADTDMDYAVELMEYTVNQFRVPVSNFFPDGAWYEGPSYWGYAGPYVARIMQTMQSAFGHRFGYENATFLNNIADYPIYTTGDQGSFIIGDSHFNANSKYNSSFFIIGSLANNFDLQSYSIQMAEETKSAEPLTVLLYDPSKTYNGKLKTTTDKLFRNFDQVTMRSSFNGNQNTFCGMTVQRKNGSTSMMDVGTLAFDALGERWITNHGRETYYKGYHGGTSERWTWYRTRAEAASCIVINPSDYRGQEYGDGTMGIDEFESDSSSAYAVADITDAYALQASSYKRGIQLTDNRRAFVVQDEIVLKEASEMYSFFNIYKADIELLADGKSAILRKDNKKVYVSVDCDRDFTLGTMNAEPLPTSPLPDPAKPNTPNPDFKKLFIYFDGIESANIRVCFMPYLCEEELESFTCRDFEPMSDWSVQNGSESMPVLSDIKINGTSVDGFDPYNRCYISQERISPYHITPVYDSGKYSVKVQNDRDTDAINILVSDKTDSTNINSYTLYVPQLSYPETTYTNSSFGGVMHPQEHYRISNGTSLSAMYFKDSAPKDCKRAVLTVYAKVVGDEFATLLKQCKLNPATELKYLAGSNTPVSSNSKSAATLYATNISAISGEGFQKLEYDITSVIPDGGGNFVFAMLPELADEDYIVLPSHRNSDYSLRPRIKYYSQ